MEVFMEVMLPILVLMLVGTGVMYVYALTDSSTSLCIRCIE